MPRGRVDRRERRRPTWSGRLSSEAPYPPRRRHLSPDPPMDELAPLFLRRIRQSIDIDIDVFAPVVWDWRTGVRVHFFFSLSLSPLSLSLPRCLFPPSPPRPFYPPPFLTRNSRPRTSTRSHSSSRWSSRPPPTRSVSAAVRSGSLYSPSSSTFPSSRRPRSHRSSSRRAR